jgi:DinB family protein
MAVRSPQLTEIDAQVRANSERARGIVARVGESKLAIAPRPKSWSVAECLVHLNLTSKVYFPVWREAFADARDRQLFGDGPFKMDLWGKMLSCVEPPPKFRFPAPPNFQPLDIGPPDQVLASFLSHQDQLLAAVAGAKGLALDRMKITSPFARQVRYSVWSSLVVTAAHQRRHLWQAERVADVILK